MELLTMKTRKSRFNQAFVTVDLAGELDIYTADDFESTLEDLFKKGQYKIILVGVVGAVHGGLLTDSLYWDFLGLGGVLGFSAFSALILILLYRGFFGPESKA